VKPDPRYRYVVLLGGSAAFGAFSSSDEHCISFVLERLLNESNKTDRPFKVINLGMGFYNSFQELLSFILYGMKYKPEFVVTFDGFNDASVSSSRHSNKRVPLVSGNYYYTKEVLDKVNDLAINPRAKKSFWTGESKSTGWDKESGDFVNDVVALYQRDIDLLCLVARQNNARIILTLQPIQVTADGHLAWKDSREDIEKIYELLPGSLKTVASKYDARFINFQDIFSRNQEYNNYFSYTDPVHLIDKGQEIVAERIYLEIKGLLNEKQK
jgi:lysophospholipase L1-like esterase